MNKKTISLECACCGLGTNAYKQWWNQDTGYGLCDDCIAWLLREGRDTREGIEFTYGKFGIHHSINQEVSNECL